MTIFDALGTKPTPIPEPSTVRPDDEFGGDEPLDFEVQMMMDAIQRRAKRAKGLGPKPGRVISRSLLSGE